MDRYKILILLFLSLMSVGCGNLKGLPKVRHLNPICIKPYQDEKFKTCREYKVKINNERIIIPARFVTDLASIPRFIWPIVSPMRSKTITPAVLHDYLYANPNGHSRQFADDVFYAALLKNGLSKGSAYRYYATVRTFGWMFFNKKKEKHGN
jgi:hypothetical protein